MKKIFKDIFVTAVTFGAGMAILCLLFFRDAPLKENLLRILGTFICVVFFMGLPFVITGVMGILFYPFTSQKNKKKR